MTETTALYALEHAYNPVRRASGLVLTADTALRLSLYFGNTPEFWMNLQAHYDLKVARRGLSPQEMRRIRARRAA